MNTPLSRERRTVWTGRFPPGRNDSRKSWNDRRRRSEKNRHSLRKKGAKQQERRQSARQRSRQSWMKKLAGRRKKKRQSGPGRKKKRQGKKPGRKRRRQRKEAGTPIKDASKKKAREKRLSAQKSIPYKEMGRDGICRVQDRLYSKTIRFYDINYQLAQNEDKSAIFENWCDFLNYFDSTIRFQLSFINHRTNMAEYENVIRIEPQGDAFDDVRMEYAQMLRDQLAKGNNGLMRAKYITFAIEANGILEARPRLERIEADVLNNFKILGVQAYPLNGAERLQIMYETFNPEQSAPFAFDYSQLLRTGLSTKDFIAPTSFTFKQGRYFRMGNDGRGQLPADPCPRAHR